MESVERTRHEIADADHLGNTGLMKRVYVVFKRPITQELRQGLR